MEPFEWIPQVFPLWMLLLTRSIISILQNMAADVQVPAEDPAQHHELPGYEAGHGVAETAG